MSQKKIRTAVIGATGMVGQQFLILLENHPWFEITVLGASKRSAGVPYAQAVEGRWHMEQPLPGYAAGITVIDAFDIGTIKQEADLVFCAVSLSADKTRELEETYAQNGLWVVSNNSAHRHTPDVPMMMPEVNPGHLDILKQQKRRLGKGAGGIVVKPNCSIQGFVMTLAPLIEAGYSPARLVTANLQAVSGAGYPGQASIDVIDNCVPLPGEEEKNIREPLKILGSAENGIITPNSSILISAHCMRVPVIHGHLSQVSLGFDGEVPSSDDIITLWRDWRPLPQQLELPSAPQHPVIVFEKGERPQQRLDRDAGKGMSVTAGRLRSCTLFDYRYSCMAHNTIRGAAGGGVLTAELLAAKGWIT